MRSRLPTAVLVLTSLAAAQADPDRDGDGLSDFRETHKYKTDPRKADSDGDGVPDGDLCERREYQYTIRTVVQVMRPVTIEHLCDDHQDARVLDETADWVELEVVHYPFTTVAGAITADPQWRSAAAKMQPWTQAGPTADWNEAMRGKLLAALAKDGIDASKLDDKTLVERAAGWLCKHAQNHDAFTAFVTAFDDKGRPYLPESLRAAVSLSGPQLEQAWQRDISARGMFELGLRGSCTSSSIYLNGCLRALGVPTRIVLCIPVVDASDPQELRLLDRGLTHRALRATVLPAIKALVDSWASHSFNEVFVGGRWRRLNYEKLGQDIADPNLFGLITHVATFSDWADARMAATIGARQTLHRDDDVFGGRNPYSTITLRDEFGPHCGLANAEPPPLSAKVTALHWGDAAETAVEIRDWFAQRGVFGLIARIEGPRSGAELKQLLEQADLRILLVADGKPTLAVGFEARAWWWKGDHAFVVVPFGPADRAALVADTAYRFVARNQKGNHWSVGEGVLAAGRR